MAEAKQRRKDSEQERYNTKKQEVKKSKNGKKFKTHTKTKEIIHENAFAMSTTASTNTLSEVFIQQVLEWFTNRDLNIWLQTSDISDIELGRFTR